MINRIFFVTQNETHDLLPAGEDQVFICRLVAAGDNDGIQRLYREMSTTSQVFSIGIEAETNADNIDYAAITSFLWLPGYLRAESELPLTLIASNREMLETVASRLELSLIHQGITRFRIYQVITARDQDVTGIATLSSLASLEKDYLRLLNTDSFYDQSLFVRVDDRAEITGAFNLLRKTEDHFRAQHPRLYQLALTAQRQASALNKLKLQQLALEAELKYQQEHNEILRATHPAKELQDYYNAQYEVLPAWYKRFGHLLKLISGKRTFHALTKQRKK
jgi:hypothetical protein